MARTRKHYKKNRRIYVYNTKKRKWINISAKNPDYEWRDGNLVHKPYM